MCLAGPYYKVRVVELVDDVAKANGIEPDMDAPVPFHGPGFLGRIEDPNNGDYDVGEEGYFMMDEVIPGSKNKYYFPDPELGDDRNSYRRFAARKAASAIARPFDYVPEGKTRMTVGELKRVIKEETRDIARPI